MEKISIWKKGWITWQLFFILFQLLQDGATSIPTKPKGRPKKVQEEIDENEEHFD